MYRILACDDEKDHLEAICTLTEDILKEAGVPGKVEPYQSRAALLAALEHGEGHCLLLLDILLGADGNGVELARELRALRDDIGIIFTTTCSDYLLDGYDVHAIQYLLKPLDRDKLRKAILYDFKHNYRDVHLIVSTRTGKLAIRLDKLFYLESVRREVVAHLDDGKTIGVGEGFSAIVERLGKDRFRLCYRTICVSLKQIRGIYYGTLELTTGERLPVGRKFQKEIEEAFITYLKKESK